MSKTSLLSLREVLSRVELSQSHWYSRMKAGKAPRPQQIGAASVAWKASDIDRFIKDRGPLTTDWKGVRRSVRRAAS